MPFKMGETPFFNTGRLATLPPILGDFDADGLVDSGDPRVDFDWNNRVMGTPLNYHINGPVDPWYVPSYYEDSDAVDQVALIDEDTNAAVDLAVRYLVTGNLDALNSAIEIISAWSYIEVFTDDDDSALVWASRFPKILQAAMMLKHTPNYTTALHVALSDVATRGLEISPSYRVNNWGNWGVCLEIACATFLEDRAMLINAIARWRQLFDYAIRDDVPIYEVNRQENIQNGDGRTGLWYSNYLLEAMTVGAEWARFAGEWLYDYAGIDGSTFVGLYKNVRHWTRFPELFPYNTSGTPSVTIRTMAHDDILHALDPDAESQWLLDNFPNGSSRDVYGMRQYVLTYRHRPLYG
jgi:hypothetical protein